MAYRPHDRNPSGIMFFGTSASDQAYESSTDFTIGGGYLHASNITVDDGGTIGSATTPGAITIASDGDVSLVGNLTINGTTTTVNSTTVTVDDPIFTLGGDTAPASDDDKDRGIEFRWHNGAASKIGFFGFDDSTGKFTFIPDATNSSEVFSGTAGTIVADLEGDVTGELIGNASTATLATQAQALYISRNFSITGEVTASAIGFDGTGNVALDASLDATAITDQTAETSVHNDDLILIYDDSASALRKMTKANFVSGLGGGGMASFNITDGSTSQQIDDGEDITFADGTGAEFVVSATNTVTVNSVDSEIDHDSLSNFVANEHIDHTSVTLTAGDGLTGGGDISANRTFAVNVDDSTVEINSDTVRVKDAGITEAKRSRTIETATSTKTADKDITLVNSTGGSVVISLPENGASGKVMVVKRVDSSSNTVTIQRTGSDTIDGATSYQLYHIYETLTFCSDGSNWYII